MRGQYFIYSNVNLKFQYLPYISSYIIPISIEKLYIRLWQMKTHLDFQ